MFSSDFDDAGMGERRMGVAGIFDADVGDEQFDESDWVGLVDAHYMQNPDESDFAAVASANTPSDANGGSSGPSLRRQRPEPPRLELESASEPAGIPSEDSTIPSIVSSAPLGPRR